MKTFAKWALLIGTGAALAGCQSEEERLMAQRDAVMSACRERTQAATTTSMQNVDVEQFCNCLADGFEAAGSSSQPDTIAIGEQCEMRAQAPTSYGAP